MCTHCAYFIIHGSLNDKINQSAITYIFKGSVRISDPNNIPIFLINFSTPKYVYCQNKFNI